MPYVKEHIRLKHLCLASLANLKSSWDEACLPNKRRLPRDWLLHARLFGELAPAVAVLHLLAQSFECRYALSPGLLSLRLCRLLAENSKKGLSIRRSTHQGICYFEL